MSEFTQHKGTVYIHHGDNNIVYKINGYKKLIIKNGGNSKVRVKNQNESLITTSKGYYYYQNPLKKVSLIRRMLNFNVPTIPTSFCVTHN